MEMAQYEARFCFKKARARCKENRKQRTRLMREERRMIGKELYHQIEKNILVILAGMIKLAVCGGFGMLLVCFLLGLPVSVTIWAAACAGCLAYRWLGRLIIIEPKEKKTKKTPHKATSFQESQEKAKPEAGH